MATNRKQATGDRITATASECTGPNDPIESGDPVVWGQIPGVALIDEDTTNDEVEIQRDGVFELSVKGEDDAGANEAVAAGDLIFMDTDGELNKDEVNGVRFGYALAAVTSGQTTAINVAIGY